MSFSDPSDIQDEDQANTIAIEKVGNDDRKDYPVGTSEGGDSPEAPLAASSVHVASSTPVHEKQIARSKKPATPPRATRVAPSLTSPKSPQSVDVSSPEGLSNWRKEMALLKMEIAGLRSRQQAAQCEMMRAEKKERQDELKKDEIAYFEETTAMRRALNLALKEKEEQLKRDFIEMKKETQCDKRSERMARHKADIADLSERLAVTMELSAQQQHLPFELREALKDIHKTRKEDYETRRSLKSETKKKEQEDLRASLEAQRQAGASSQMQELLKTKMQLQHDVEMLENAKNRPLHKSQNAKPLPSTPVRSH